MKLTKRFFARVIPAGLLLAIGLAHLTFSGCEDFPPLYECPPYGAVVTGNSETEQALHWTTSGYYVIDDRGTLHDASNTDEAYSPGTVRGMLHLAAFLWHASRDGRGFNEPLVQTGRSRGCQRFVEGDEFQEVGLNNVAVPILTRGERDIANQLRLSLGLYFDPNSEDPGAFVDRTVMPGFLPRIGMDNSQISGALRCEGIRLGDNVTAMEMAMGMANMSSAALDRNARNLLFNSMASETESIVRIARQLGQSHETPRQILNEFIDQIEDQHVVFVSDIELDPTSGSANVAGVLRMPVARNEMREHYYACFITSSNDETVFVANILEARTRALQTAICEALAQFTINHPDLAAINAREGR